MLGSNCCIATSEITAKPAKKSKDAVASTKAKSKSTNSKAKGPISKPPPKKALSTQRVTPSDDESDEKNAAESEDEDGDGDEEVDDQTAALLAGFDSEEDPEPTGEGFQSGGDVGKVDKKARKQALAAQKKASASDEPGVVYLGRLPHGFYEQEIKSYFSQFGEVTRYRVSRNPKTGASKHYAFVEFKSCEVAEIVAKTMDNYLLFGHILKCKLLAPSQVHKDLWKGANKRFKAVPWNKIEGRKLKQGLDEAGWDKRNTTEEERRAEKAKKAAELGYEFEAPELKSAKDVEKTKPEENNGAIEGAVVAEEETVAKAIETSDTGAVTVTETVQISEVEMVDAPEVDAPEVESTKGKKKSKKTAKITKETVVSEVTVDAGESSTAPEPRKSTRTKKAKAVEEKIEEPVTETEVTEEPATKLKSKKSKDKLNTKKVEEEKPVPALKSKKSKEKIEETVAEAEVTEKPSTKLRSKKSKDKLDTKDVEEDKPAPALKSKKSKDKVAESSTTEKAKRVRKPKA